MIPRCHEQVIDYNGHYVPCDRPASAERTDPEDGTAYPVCKAHRYAGEAER